MCQPFITCVGHSLRGMHNRLRPSRDGSRSTRIPFCIQYTFPSHEGKAPLVRGRRNSSKGKRPQVCWYVNWLSSERRKKLTCYIETIANLCFKFLVEIIGQNRCGGATDDHQKQTKKPSINHSKSGSGSRLWHPSIHLHQKGYYICARVSIECFPLPWRRMLGRMLEEC